MSVFSRIANVFRGDRLNRDIAEEYASHLEEAVLAGRDPAEAKRALGNTLRRVLGGQLDDILYRGSGMQPVQQAVVSVPSDHRAVVAAFTIASAAQ